MSFARTAGQAAIVAAGLVAQTGHALASSGPAANVVASWVQVAPGSSATALAAGSWGDQPASLTNTILVRAVVTDGVCPAAVVDTGMPLTMTLRFSASTLTNLPVPKPGYPVGFVDAAATTPANFASGVPMATTSWGECEAVVPAGHKTVSVGGVSMKLPVAVPRRILVIADTGCRLNGNKAANGANQQNCADPSAFPLAYLSNVEASYSPDLIVHVGDWFYRDTNCLTNGAETYPGCNTTSSPNYETWGDTFDSWNADILFPAKNLLAAAPWVMTRGNHESCGRGARGWFALLDALPYDAAKVACTKTAAYPAPNGTTPTFGADFEPTYVAHAGGVNFIVHDSSFANDGTVDQNMARNYDIDISNILNALGTSSTNIFTTHKPVFGLIYGNPVSPTPTNGLPRTRDNAGDFTEQAVFTGGTFPGSQFLQGVPESISMFLSGHIHQVQYMNFSATAKLPPQMIVGVGGDLLDPDMNTGLVPGGAPNQPSFVQTQTDFVTNNFFDKSLNGLARATNAFSKDEFGWALFRTVIDSSGQATGFHADVYNTSSTRTGSCNIVFHPRSLHCNLAP